MNPSRKHAILELARKSGGIRPHDLKKELGISLEAIHRHLSAMVRSGVLEKKGRAPFVLYVAVTTKTTPLRPTPTSVTSPIIDEHFCYFTPTGEEFLGIQGFQQFLERTAQAKDIPARAKEYEKIFREVESHRTKINPKEKTQVIDGTAKLKSTFGECLLEKVYYSEFYALPKYGKTKLGQYLLHGKSGQNLKLIQMIAQQTASDIRAIVAYHHIEAVAFAPHSIPRKVPFLREYRSQLALALPEIKLMKAFAGNIPIAQKSLSKLSERIENARDTIFLASPEVPFRRILVIDDAIGSGSTLNEIARKLISAPPPALKRKIFGYAVVGSYKGFEVIREV